MIKVLYNSLADNHHGEENAAKIKKLSGYEDAEFVDLIKADLREILSRSDDKIVLAGGDGTIHFFINKFGGKVPEHPLYYFPTGNGNDFKNDIKEHDSDEVVLLNDYLKNLPTVSVNNCKKIYFLNGIGYGIDGYCCEEGDRLKKQTTKPINYAAIAIKGILGKFKQRNAVVTVDGVEHKYSHVWLTATMNGRFYGGGMNIAPAQDRLNTERKQSVVVFHCKSKLKTLMVFPSIFKGKHVEHKKMVEVLTGHEITVAFDRPTPLQVDGETYLNVSHYSVEAKQTENV
ncbi:MAG: diacylglycerol kinase family protein [Oscillospiraceae bacterium]|nr:diacylglycerol kinase family protein [Oscillospiraceae bacterium]